MTSPVFSLNEVSLDGIYYPIKGQVRTRDASSLPPKQITGDYTKDSHPNSSVHTWQDFIDGIGIDRMTIGEDDRRSWFSTWSPHKNHLVFPPLATETSAPSGATGNPLIGELGGSVVAAYDTDVRDYVHGTDTWNASARTTLAATPTDVLNLTIGPLGSKVEYLVFCYTSGYAYSSSIATWATRTTNAVKMATWDNRLWAIDATGRLWYTFGALGGTEIYNAQLQLSHNDVITGLFTARDASDNDILYCTTERYVYSHDFDNCKWIRTGVTITPEGLTAANHTRKVTIFQDQIYVASSAGVVNFINKREGPVEEVGPDQDDGLPEAEYENLISCMAASVKDLIVGGAAIGSSDTALVMAWNTRGWRVLWEAPGTNTNVISLHVAYIGAYRLWFGYNNRVWWLRLNQTNPNPKRVSGWTFATSAHLKTPWFDANQSEVGLALSEVRVKTNDCSSTETLKVNIAYDYIETYTELGTISTNGITSYSIPTSRTPEGRAYEAARIELIGARGIIDTLCPNVASVTLVFRKKLPFKWGFLFDIVLKDYRQVSAATLRASLETAFRKETFVKLMYRGPDAVDAYYVDLRPVTGVENSGQALEGLTQVTAVEM